MNKEELKEIFIKVFLLFMGLLCGFILFEMVQIYPNMKGRIFIFSLIALMFLLLIIQNYRYKSNIKYLLHHIAKDIEEIGESKMQKEIKTNTSNIKEINKLYTAVDKMRTEFWKEIQIKDHVLELENSLAVNTELDGLFEDLLPKLVEHTKSNWGIVYIYNRMTEKLELKKSVGLSKNVYKEFDVEIGEGLIGLAAKSKEIRILKEIPEDTVFENRTFLGKILPKSVMTVPVFEKEELVAVLAFGSIFNYEEKEIGIISLLRNYMGFSISNCLDYERTQRMTKELQFQNELIQNMNDELEKKVQDRTDYLNSIINSIQDYLIVAMDKEGYITTWNEGAHRIRGYTSEETVGRHITMFYDSQEEKDSVAKQLQKAEKYGKFYECGWRRRKDGSEYFAEIVVTPIYNQYGELQGFTNITKDITVTKNLEKALLYEKAYNEKIIANSTRALLFVGKNGVIMNISKAAMKILTAGTESIVGKYIQDFFVDSEVVAKNIKNICKTSGRGEEVNELLYKRPGYEKIRISAIATDIEEEDNGSGAILYLTPLEKVEV